MKRDEFRGLGKGGMMKIAACASAMVINLHMRSLQLGNLEGLLTWAVLDSIDLQIATVPLAEAFSFPAMRRAGNPMFSRSFRSSPETCDEARNSRREG